MTSIRAELLYTPDCPHADRAEHALRWVLASENVEADVVRVPVADLDQAAVVGFHGSPTIRLDGIDVVPVDGAQPVNLACRLYRDGSGRLDGVPPDDAIRAAIVARLADRRSHRGPLARVRSIPGHAMRAGFVWASRQRRIEGMVRRMPITKGLVRRFVAGETLPAVMPVLERLRAAGMHTTVDVLGESVATPEAARAAAERYLETLAALSDADVDRNVSLKLTQMGLDIDERLCRGNVSRIAAAAAEAGAFMRVDMEDHTKTDVTLAIVRDLHAAHGNVGVVIQSYLRRSESDVAALCAEGIRIRLCKGAYNEPAALAFPTKAEVDESYAQLMERLLLEGTYPALATHDERLIARAKRIAKRHDIGPDRFEFQMLYGVRRDLQERLVREGYAVRVYVPFGGQWYPYFMRRLAERPANVLFIVRNLLRERRAA
jgi:proline dehydrogenase